MYPLYDSLFNKRLNVNILRINHGFTLFLLVMMVWSFILLLVQERWTYPIEVLDGYKIGDGIRFDGRNTDSNDHVTENFRA